MQQKTRTPDTMNEHKIFRWNMKPQSLSSPLIALALFAGIQVVSMGTESAETAIRIPKIIRSRQLDNGHIEYLVPGVDFKPNCRLEPPPPLSETTREHYRWTDQQRIEREQIEEEQRYLLMRTEQCRELLASANNAVNFSVRAEGYKDVVSVEFLIPDKAIALRGLTSAAALRAAYSGLVGPWRSSALKQPLTPWLQLLLMEERGEAYNPDLFRLALEIGMPEGEALDRPIFVYSQPIAEGGLALTFRSSVVDSAGNQAVADYALKHNDGQYVFQRMAPPGFSHTSSQTKRRSSSERSATSLNLALDRKGTAELKGYAQLCMHAARFAIVVRDDRNDLLWDAFGQADDHVTILAHDLTGNGRDEIVIAETNHGKFQLRVFADAP